MCRWKALVISIVLCKHLSAQPITDINNDRTPRQLNFGECCPCVDNIADTLEVDDELRDTMGAGSNTMFSRSGDLDDCPCRDSDSRGASSMFFPNAVGSAGAFLRPDDKKENLKPLFNPEVGLATSVLETLREVTDEEYQDALLRDAAKSAVEVADDFLFGDATPQESANILTVVVKPKFAESNEDVIPENLHNQKSRCIHPTSSARSTTLSQTRPSISHRNFYDVDSGTDASNVHEQVLPAKIDTKDKELIPSYLKTINDADEYCQVTTIPDILSRLKQNNLKELHKPSLFQTIRDNVDSLNRIPENNNTDLDPAASNHELVEGKGRLLHNRPHWLDFKENSSPTSIKNLLNLKDVELIPLKELFSNQLQNIKNKKSKRLLTSISSHDTQMTPAYDITENNVKTDYNEDPSLTSCLEEEIIDRNDEVAAKQKYDSNDLDTETRASSIVAIDKTLDHKDSVQTNDNYCIEDENNQQQDSVTDTSNDINKTVESLVENNQQYASKTDSTTDVNKVIESLVENNQQDTSVTDTTSNINKVIKSLVENNQPHVSESGTTNNINKVIQSLVENNQQHDSKSDTTNGVNKVIKSLIENNQQHDSGTDITNNVNKVIESLVENNRQHNSVTDTTNNVNKVIDSLVENNNHQHNSGTDIINNVNKVIESLVKNNQQNLGNMARVSDESCNHNEQSQNNVHIGTNPSKKLFEPISAESAMSVIKENIDKKLEELRNIGAKIKNKNIRHQEMDQSNLETNNMPVLSSINYNDDAEVNGIDLENGTNALDKATYILKPSLFDDKMANITQLLQLHNLDDNINDSSNHDTVTLQDLQNLSNSLLLQEENGFQPKIVDEKRGNENEHFDKEVNTLNQFNIINSGLEVEEENLNEFNERHNYCITSEPDIPKQSQSGLNDGSAENIRDAMNPISEVGSSLRTQRPLDIMSLPPLHPLPTLDDIKVRLVSLFEKSVSESNRWNLGQSDTVRAKSAMEDKTSDNIQEVASDNSSRNTNLDVSTIPQIGIIDVNTDASDTIMTVIPEDSDILDKGMVLPPRLSFTDKSYSNLNNPLKLPPRQTLLDDIKVKQTSLFYSNDSSTNKLGSNSMPNILGENAATIVKNDIFKDEDNAIDNQEIEPGPSNVSPVESDVDANSDSSSNLQPTEKRQLTILKEPLSGLNIFNSHTPKPMPTFDDLKKKLITLFSKKDRETRSKEKNAEEYNNFNTDTEDNNNNNIVTATRSPPDIVDTNVAASDAISNMLPTHNDNFSLTPVIQSPLNFSGILNTSPLESLQKDMKEELNVFDDKGIILKNCQGSLEPELTSNTLDVLNPVMATEASTSSFQARLPSSKFLDIWTSNPERNMLKTTPRRNKFKPLYDDLLGTAPIVQKTKEPKAGIPKFRIHQNTPNIWHSLPKDNFKVLENPITSSSNILDTITRNHDDFNDKIRNLHMDFNDRMDSVRKDISDRSKFLARGSRINNMFKPSNNLKSENKAIQRLKLTKPTINTNHAAKSLAPLKLKAPKPVKRITLPKAEPKKFWMPTAASVHVPKTVEVPKLKATSMKLPHLPLQKASIISSRNTESPDPTESLESFRRQTSNLNNIPLRRQYYPKKEATLKVSLSTTPVPLTSAENKLNNISPPFKIFNKLMPQKLSTHENTLKETPVDISDNNANNLGWPRSTERTILSKFRDAVQSRLSIKPPIKSKQFRISAEAKPSKNTAYGFDMSQAASEHGNVKDESLRENISYNCKMVCAKE